MTQTFGSMVTALSTQPGGTSLYVVGLDDEGHGGGRVWSNYFPSSNNQWSGWFPLGDNVFHPGSMVTALSTQPGGTSLYVVGLDGQVWSNYFPSSNNQWSGWFPLGPNTFQQGSTVTALSTQPGGTSLYVVGLDEGHGGGRVWSNYFPSSNNQWSGWFPLGDNVFPSGSVVTALSTQPGGTSLYVVGLDGQVWSNYFPSSNNQWSGWFSVGIEPVHPEIGVIVEPHRLGAWLHISGHGFTPGGIVRFSVEGLEGAAGAKSIGVFTFARLDGTLPDDVWWDGRFWPPLQPPQVDSATLKALDEVTGRTATCQIPALY